MKKYARIENGEVREIIPFNPEGRFTPELVAQFKECNDDTEQGELFENGQYKKKVKDLKKEQKDSLNYHIKQINSNLNEHVGDLVNLLISKNIITETELSVELKGLLVERNNLKSSLASLRSLEVGK